MTKYIGHHDPACGGCPKCDDLAAAILANPTNPVLREAMGRPRLRVVAEHALRKAAAPPVPPVVEATDAAWLSHLARVLGVHPDMDDATERGDGKTHRGFQPTDDPAYSPFGHPPDGYKLALTSRKEATDARTTSPFGQPPNGYEIALNARKEATR